MHISRNWRNYIPAFRLACTTGLAGISLQTSDFCHFCHLFFPALNTAVGAVGNAIQYKTNSCQTFLLFPFEHPFPFRSGPTKCHQMQESFSNRLHSSDSRVARLGRMQSGNVTTKRRVQRAPGPQSGPAWACISSDCGKELAHSPGFFNANQGCGHEAATRDGAKRLLQPRRPGLSFALHFSSTGLSLSLG